MADAGDKADTCFFVPAKRDAWQIGGEEGLVPYLFDTVLRLSSARDDRLVANLEKILHIAREPIGSFELLETPQNDGNFE